MTWVDGSFKFGNKVHYFSVQHVVFGFVEFLLLDLNHDSMIFDV